MNFEEARHSLLYTWYKQNCYLSQFLVIGTNKEQTIEQTTQNGQSKKSSFCFLKVCHLTQKSHFAIYFVKVDFKLVLFKFALK